MSIQEHLNKIRNAVYGHEVRESIAKGIETAYDDASEKDNANMEVKIARGTHPNLRSRLEEVDDKQQQNTAQLQQTEQELNAQLAEKIDEVTYNAEHNVIIFYSAGAIRHSFSVTEASTSETVQAYIDTLIADGNIQGATVSDGSIGPSKTTFLSYSKLIPNIITGSYYNFAGKLLETAAFSRTEKILLKAGETIEVKATGYLQAVSIIAVVTSANSFIKTGALSVDSTERLYRYTATEQTEYVVVSYNNLNPVAISKYLDLDYVLSNLKEKTSAMYVPKNTDTLDRLVMNPISSNIFNEQSIKNTPDAFISVVGTVMAQENTGISSKMIVSPGDVIRFKYLPIFGPSSNGSIFEGFLYDRNDNPLYLIGVDNSSITPPYPNVEPVKTGTYVTLTIPNNHNVSYARINYQPNTEFMIVKNKPYPTTYEIFKYELEGLQLSSDSPSTENDNVDFLKYLISDVTIVGDSLMDGGYYEPNNNGAAIKESPPYFLQKLTDWTIQDVSKNGATPISWWTDFGSTTNYTDSDVVILCLGTNGGLTDTVATDVNLGTQTFANTNTGQYARIINAFKQANPDVHIFLGKVFATTGNLATTNKVIEDLATLFDGKVVDDSHLYGDPIMHPFGNAVHYGKVGNLHRAKTYLNQILKHVENDLASYEVLIDKY